jgi:methyl-accepting chemotaxis protein
MTEIKTEQESSTVRSFIALLGNRTIIIVVLGVVIQTLLISALALVMNPDIPIDFMGAALLLSLVVGFALGLVIYNDYYKRMAGLLQGYIAVLGQIADGDLLAQLDISGLDASGREGQMIVELGDVINGTLARLRNVTIGVRNAMQRLDSDTQAILEATSRQIAMANEQDAVVTETTATVNEVRATVTETAERAQSVAETAQLSVDISKSGTIAVVETINGMELIRRRVEDIADNILVLSEHTQQIGEIITAVNNLADQSRMLALNASVEAARAGEEGKGFAVVAMEVRNLADQNRDATVQVREILGEIQRATNAAVMVTEEGSKGVDEGQNLVNSAGDSIRELAGSIENAATAAMQIAASTRQQTIGMDQLTQAMRTIKHATTETVSSTMQVEASVQRLRDAAFLVNELLNDLKI